eukprot:gene10034-7924_t
MAKRAAGSLGQTRVGGLNARLAAAGAPQGTPLVGIGGPTQAVANPGDNDDDMFSGLSIADISVQAVPPVPTYAPQPQVLIQPNPAAVGGMGGIGGMGQGMAFPQPAIATSNIPTVGVQPNSALSIGVAATAASIGVAAGAVEVGVGGRRLVKKKKKNSAIGSENENMQAALARSQTQAASQLYPVRSTIQQQQQQQQQPQTISQPHSLPPQAQSPPPTFPIAGPSPAAESMPWSTGVSPSTEPSASAPDSLSYPAATPLPYQVTHPPSRASTSATSNTAPGLGPYPAPPPPPNTSTASATAPGQGLYPAAPPPSYASTTSTTAPGQGLYPAPPPPNTSTTSTTAPGQGLYPASPPPPYPSHTSTTAPGLSPYPASPPPPYTSNTSTTAPGLGPYPASPPPPYASTTPTTAPGQGLYPEAPPPPNTSTTAQPQGPYPAPPRPFMPTAIASTSSSNTMATSTFSPAPAALAPSAPHRDSSNSSSVSNFNPIAYSTYSTLPPAVPPPASLVSAPISDADPTTTTSAVPTASHKSAPTAYATPTTATNPTTTNAMAVHTNDGAGQAALRRSHVAETIAVFSALKSSATVVPPRSVAAAAAAATAASRSQAKPGSAASSAVSSTYTNTSRPGRGPASSTGSRAVGRPSSTSTASAIISKALAARAAAAASSSKPHHPPQTATPPKPPLASTPTVSETTADLPTDLTHSPSASTDVEGPQAYASHKANPPYQSHSPCSSIPQPAAAPLDRSPLPSRSYPMRPTSACSTSSSNLFFAPKIMSRAGSVYNPDASEQGSVFNDEAASQTAAQARLAARAAAAIQARQRLASSVATSAARSTSVPSDALAATAPEVTSLDELLTYFSAHCTEGPADSCCQAAMRAVSQLSEHLSRLATESMQRELDLIEQRRGVLVESAALSDSITDLVKQQDRAAELEDFESAAALEGQLTSLSARVEAQTEAAEQLRQQAKQQSVARLEALEAEAGGWQALSRFLYSLRDSRRAEEGAMNRALADDLAMAVADHEDADSALVAVQVEYEAQVVELSAAQMTAEQRHADVNAEALKERDQLIARRGSLQREVQELRAILAQRESDLGTTTRLLTSTESNIKCLSTSFAPQVASLERSKRRLASYRVKLEQQAVELANSRSLLESQAASAARHQSSALNKLDDIEAAAQQSASRAALVQQQMEEEAGALGRREALNQAAEDAEERLGALTRCMADASNGLQELETRHRQ